MAVIVVFLILFVTLLSFISFISFLILYWKRALYCGQHNWMYQKCSVSEVKKEIEEKKEKAWKKEKKRNKRIGLVRKSKKKKKKGLGWENKWIKVKTNERGWKKKRRIEVEQKRILTMLLPIAPSLLSRWDAIVKKITDVY